MKVAYKTLGNAIYAGLTRMSRAGAKGDIGQARFDAVYKVHQNRRGFILTAR